MSSEFTDNHFKPCVKEFVTTVLLIDDLLEFKNTASIPETVVQLSAPVQGSARIPENNSLKESTNPDNSNNATERKVQTTELIKNFSKENLLVTPINPRELQAQTKEECVQILIKLAEKADVIILDWEMEVTFGDGSNVSNSELSGRLIELLNSDKKYRLVIIYTADNPNSISISHSENIEIKKYCKSSVYGNHYKTYEQLAVQITTDYLSSKKGLLSSTLLSTLTQLRQSTYLMLSALNKDYDIALLYHRILLENPDKTCDFCNDIIADEILSHMSLNIMKQNLDKEVFNFYLNENKIPLSFRLGGNDQRTNLTNEQKKIVVNQGYKAIFGEDISDSISKGKHLDYVVKDGDNIKLKAFSCYSMMLNPQLKPDLHLGCIVKSQSDYFFCVQPLCNSERIQSREKIGNSTPPNFLFLKLKKSSAPDFFIKTNGRYEGMEIEYSKIETFPVCGNDQGVVALEENKYVLFDESSLDYIGCLKPIYAQKFANIFAAYISRIGTDQFEWLRLKGRK